MNELEELRRIINEHLVAQRRVHTMADMLMAKIAEKLKAEQVKREPKPEGGE